MILAILPGGDIPSSRDRFDRIQTLGVAVIIIGSKDQALLPLEINDEAQRLFVRLEGVRVDRRAYSRLGSW